jgi:hypothetical protein
MEETVRVEPVSDWKYPVVVDNEGAEMDELDTIEECARR